MKYAEFESFRPWAKYREYNFTRLWQGLGWAMVALVIGLSLTPQPPHLPQLLGWDKAQHILAYGVLMFWFCLTFAGHWRWPVFLVALGGVLEVLQGQLGWRTTDIFDIAANTVGVFIGLGLACTPLSGSLKIIDDYLFRLWRPID
jgi:hypothetical protein